MFEETQRASSSCHLATVTEIGVVWDLTPSRLCTRRCRVQSSKCVEFFEGIISSRSKDIRYCLSLRRSPGAVRDILYYGGGLQRNVMVRQVVEIGMGKGHSFVGVHYSRRFRMELSEGSSLFVNLKEGLHHNIQHVYWQRRKCPHTIGDCME